MVTKKGSRSIKRIIRGFDIVYPIRKTNPYGRMMNATREHTIAPNLLKRQFKQNVSRKLLLIDITYMPFGNSKWPIYRPQKMLLPMKYWHITYQSV